MGLSLRVRAISFFVYHVGIFNKRRFLNVVQGPFVFAYSHGVLSVDGLVGE